MTAAPTYSTRLAAGLGLVPETLRLLTIWQPGMSGKELLSATLASGEFPTMSARRLRNVVLEGFAPRYLVEDGAPARLLKAVSATLRKDEFRALCFLFTCRANLILADFVRQVYWPRYAAGGTSVSKTDSLGFVSIAISNGRTTTHWSEKTADRVAGYLMGACADFGLLGAMKGDARPLITFHVTPTVVSVLAYELHFRGFGDNALLRSDDWSLFGLEPDDALEELKRVSLRGELIIQSAGGLTRVSWKYRSMEELAYGVAQG